MKKALLFCLALIVGLALFAETTVLLKDIKGKVEVKPMGKGWMVAKEGMKLDILATISTGFDSSVTLVIDKSSVRIDPLSRLTIDKVLEQANKLSTSLHLRVGKVSAEVKTSAGVAQDFKVTSPYSTASVRGTQFDFDGFIVIVNEGTVQLIPGKPKRDIMVVVKAKEEKKDESVGEAPQEPGPAAPPGETPPGETPPAGTDGTAELPPSADEPVPTGTTPSEEEAPPPRISEAEFQEVVAFLKEEYPNETFVFVDSQGQVLAPPPPPPTPAQAPAGSSAPGTPPRGSGATEPTGSEAPPEGEAQAESEAPPEAGAPPEAETPEAGAPQVAEAPPEAPPPEAVVVRAGQSAELKVNFSAGPSGGRPNTIERPLPPAAAAARPVERKPNEDTPPPPAPLPPAPPAPTKGSITITWEE